MICPQTKEQCRNHVTCSAIEECLHPSGGKLPPKPSIEDIERLVGVLRLSVLRHEQSKCLDTYEGEAAAHAALMAAITAYGA